MASPVFSNSVGKLLPFFGREGGLAGFHNTTHRTGTFALQSFSMFTGLRIAFQRANLLAQFPDAFSPFKLFGCSLQEAFNGRLSSMVCFRKCTNQCLHYFMGTSCFLCACLSAYAYNIHT
ncbi:hypothetical protein DUNSADRAFT_7199 [Dunaliella salina]|uniref:Encoded protein n=1 Tax=Dunaliella salina TaxID=3046 RepID=A0ABQ7FTH3_DUNSA|nr:hypothetical protein DUNSADRAFT_7199 [Dunaliella salina]|eukprot:KAF5825751.1 hypothetical protein DUNSADRAFT_7199 [Dunaliella salina]